MTEYRWDFHHCRPSWRKGGRVALCYGNSSRVKEWIDPDDQDEFARQYREHCQRTLRDALKRCDQPIRPSN